MTALAHARRRITSGWPAIAMPARKTAASRTIHPPQRKTAARLAPTTIAPLTLTSIADDGVFEGYASLFHREDLGHDVVLPGAFRDTLRQRGARGVRLLFQHDPATPIGVWDVIREDARGLFVRGRLTLGVARAREVLELLRAGAVDGLSIGFKTAKSRRDRVRGIRLIEAVDLWEISIVTFPLLTGARVTAVAQQTAPPAVRSAIAPIAMRGQAQPFARPADSLRDTARRLLSRIEQRNRDLARLGARVGVRPGGPDTVDSGTASTDLKSRAALAASIAGDRCLLALTRAALMEHHRLAHARARADGDATKGNFNPAQLRVPRGNSDGGQWIDEGGRVDSGRPQLAQNRGGRFTRPPKDHNQPKEPPKDPPPKNSLPVPPFFPPPQGSTDHSQRAIDAYRTHNNLSPRDDTVAHSTIDGKDVFGVNSSASTYTSEDRAAANQMRDILIEKYPEMMQTGNIGQMPNNALYHAEATALIRAAQQNSGRLSGRTIEIRVDRELCGSCQQVLPLVQRELGNPRIIIRDPVRVRQLLDGIWSK